MHDAAVQDRKDGSEKAELIIVLRCCTHEARGIGSRETSAARIIPSSLPPRTPKTTRSPTSRSELRLGGSHQRFLPVGQIATGTCAGHSQMPIEKIHEFGFVLRDHGANVRENAAKFVWRARLEFYDFRHGGCPFER